MTLADFVMLLGGVALFLYGMSLMGEGLKRVAGNNLELILYKLSSSVFKGILLGTGVTAVIQSSSATSVMVVGFVNSEMMKLRQAISIIMGAIIGTSVTGWIICLSNVSGSGALSLLSTDSISAIMAVIGILFRMFSKRKTKQRLGDILLGFAVLMYGMKSMSSAVSGLRNSPVFLNLLTSFKNPLLGILFGLVFTAAIQSASAAVGILQALTVTGTITFDIALPIILGVAVGASVPVLISAIGASTAGKRTALSYLVTDALMSFIFAVVFYVANAVLHFSIMDHVMNMVDVALLNSLFRVVTIFVLMPAISLIERIVCAIVKDNTDEDSSSAEINNLEERFLKYPPLAIEQTRIAVNGMSEKSQKAIRKALRLVDSYDDTQFNKVAALESVIDKYEDKIGNYLTKITGSDINTAQKNQVGLYFRCITDLERISDHALNIAENAQEMKEKNIHFTSEGQREFKIISAAVDEVVGIALGTLIDGNVEGAYKIEPLEEVIDNLCDTLKQNHSIRLSKGLCTLANGYVFNDLLTNYERVSDHCSNIAIAVIEASESNIEAHEYKDKVKTAHVNHFDEYYNEYKNKYKV